jgi:hypothetical protein
MLMNETQTPLPAQSWCASQLPLGPALWSPYPRSCWSGSPGAPPVEARGRWPCRCPMSGCRCCCLLGACQTSPPRCCQAAASRQRRCLLVVHQGATQKQAQVAALTPEMSPAAVAAAAAAAGLVPVVLQHLTCSCWPHWLPVHLLALAGGLASVLQRGRGSGPAPRQSLLCRHCRCCCCAGPAGPWRCRCSRWSGLEPWAHCCGLASSWHPRGPTQTWRRRSTSPRWDGLWTAAAALHSAHRSHPRPYHAQSPSQQPPPHATANGRLSQRSLRLGGGAQEQHQKG